MPLVDAKGRWSSFMNASRKSVANYLAAAIGQPDLMHKTITVIEQPQQKR